jgi:zinc protease
MHRRLLAALALCLAVAAPAFSAAPPFPHEASDLKPDPAVRFGTLPNGVRTVIRANQEPRERASLRLLVDAGALQETEAQRGVAHFLEHLAFNGSTHYAPGTLVEFFQRMGMNFGGDTNASTGFDRTLYLLELPNTRPATLAEGLQVLSDYAGGLFLQPKEIDSERGVILSEMRTRDSVDYRIGVAGYEFELGSTLFPRRLPIGIKDVIEKADRAAFTDFYDTWYRPERLTVLVVGDIDPAAVEAQVRTAFSGLAARGPARPDPDLGRIDTTPGVRVKFHPEPEAPATVVGLSLIEPYAPEADTAARRLRDLPRSLAFSMLDHRLEMLAKLENAPFTAADSYANEHYRFFRSVGLELTTEPARWRDALALGEKEVRRVLEHGFQPGELKEVVANYRNRLEQAVKTAATRRSSSLVGALASSLTAQEVFTAPADDLALLGPALDRITPEQCTAAFRAAWSAPYRNLMVAGRAPLPNNPAPDTATVEAEIRSVYNNSRAVEVAAPVARTEQSWGYTDFGPAGTVARREQVADLGITLVTFANGVRLNLKPTEFEAGRIQVSVRTGSGLLTEPRDQPGLAYFAGSIFSAGGLGKHSADDLDRILAGRNVGFGFRVASDALTVSATTNRDDLLLELQLIGAHFTDPGYRPEAVRQALKAQEETYASLEHTPSGPIQLEVTRRLASGDPRFGMPAKAELQKRTVDEVKAWLTPQLTGGPMEIALVGDLDVEAAIAAVAKTLGALPARPARPDFAAERRVAFPAQGARWSFTVPTEIPKGVVALYWPTTDANDVSRTRRLTILGTIFTDRLRVKVREEIGGAYSPAAGSSSSDTFTGYGYLLANVIVDPPAANAIADAVRAIAEDLRTKGVTEDELNRAKQPVLTNVRESARTNSYWIGSVVHKAQEKPEVLAWSRTRTADFEAITKADIDALARQYLVPERTFQVIVLPEARPATK